MESKPQLRPVRVPWMVSPSVPYLEADTAADGRPRAVTFIGYFKLSDKRSPDFANPRRVQRPARFELATTQGDGPYRMVRIVFEGGFALRELPSFGDHEVVEESKYDWSLVPGGVEDESLDENFERFDRLWVDTGLCPDPRMYEVHNSDWLAELGPEQESLHHYLILGHDEYIEVLAKGWRWEEGQPTD